MSDLQDAPPISRKPSRAVEQQIGEDWVVVMEWPDGVEDGGPARLVIQPKGKKMPVGGLSSTVLRKIDFRSAIARLQDESADSAQRHTRSVMALRRMREFERDQLRSALSEGITPQYLALLSYNYVQAAERGQANINDYLADLVGKPVGTVRGHLNRARGIGLLTGSHGRKGGELSDEAEKLIEPYVIAWIDELSRLTSDSET